MSNPPRAEIEHRTRRLLERLEAGLPPELLREQLESIVGATGRIGYDEFDPLTAAVNRARAWLARDDVPQSSTR